ncbi:hypothetical protein D9M69_630060 [compost metagenome]
MENTVLLCQLFAKRHFDFNNAWLTAREFRADQFHGRLAAKTLFNALFKIRLGNSVRWHKVP